MARIHDTGKLLRGGKFFGLKIPFTERFGNALDCGMCGDGKMIVGEFLKCEGCGYVAFSIRDHDNGCVSKSQREEIFSLKGYFGPQINLDL